jgi:GLPGLI family protein
MKYLTLVLIIIFSFQYVFSQKNDVFSGELTYEIERVDKKDTNRTFMIIYAKDSLLKVVNFNSNSGKQQLIKHLRLNRSYILLETPKQNFAVRTNEHLVIDSIENYTFKKQMGTRKIAGIKVKKLSVKHKEISEDLTFYYTKSIFSKYANIYKNLPGLPLLFYVPTADGLLKYTLKELKYNNPPLDLFMIPQGYEIISFEEFTNKFLNPSEQENKK